ncbi:MAG: helix-turn-helix transcriptional regulator [Bacteroidetes bacterium]|nr:helix-turn-helix transcriptional regulator [Bacteroidota bacterium]
MDIERLKKLDRSDCPIGKSIDEIGDKWIMFILRECFFGFRRFEDYQSILKISRSVLTSKLKLMVERDLLKKNEYKTDNQRSRCEYTLTDKGRDLFKVLMAFFEWAHEHILEEGQHPYYLAEKNTGEIVKLSVTKESGETIRPRDVRVKENP